MKYFDTFTGKICLQGKFLIAKEREGKSLNSFYLIVCPGKTGLANLALTARTFDMSEAAKTPVISRVAMPSVHKP